MLLALVSESVASVVVLLEVPVPGVVPTAAASELGDGLEGAEGASAAIPGAAPASPTAAAAAAGPAAPTAPTAPAVAAGPAAVAAGGARAPATTFSSSLEVSASGGSPDLSCSEHLVRAEREQGFGSREQRAVRGWQAQGGARCVSVSQTCTAHLSVSARPWSSSTDTSCTYVPED